MQICCLQGHSSQEQPWHSLFARNRQPVRQMFRIPGKAGVGMELQQNTLCEATASPGKHNLTHMLVGGPIGHWYLEVLRMVMGTEDLDAGPVAGPLSHPRASSKGSGVKEKDPDPLAAVAVASLSSSVTPFGAAHTSSGTEKRKRIQSQKEGPFKRWRLRLRFFRKAFRARSCPITVAHSASGRSTAAANTQGGVPWILLCRDFLPARHLHRTHSIQLNTPKANE